jgi:hypothetical protein
MSLMLCPECQHEVSNEAVACPNCGRPLAVPTPIVQRKVVIAETTRDEFPKWVLVPIVVIGALLVFLMVAIFRNNEPEANRRVEVNVSATPRKSTDSRDTVSKIETEPNQVNVPSSSTTVNTPPPSSVSVPQTVVPPSQTQTAPMPSDKGLVVLDAKIMNSNGSTQSVRNEKFYLLDEDLETILNDADLEPIDGNTLSNSFGMAVLYPEKYGEFNRNALNEIKKHIKYNATTDGSGKASMKDVKPDNYYLFGITKSRNGFAIWSSPVNIISGENKMNLSPARMNDMSE